KGQASVYASVDGIDPLFEIETSQLDRIDQKFDDLRMKKLLASMDRFAVTGIRFAGKGKKPWKTTVNKVGHSWTTPEGMGIDEKRIDPILEGLTSSIVVSFTGPAPGSENLVIAFGTTDQPLEKSPAYEVEFWKKGDRLFARDLLSKSRSVVELKGDF